MPALDDIDREQRRNERAEDPRAREARRAYERWTTRLRLWAAIEREGITDPGEQARFICRRLYPDVRGAVLDELGDAVRRHALAGSPFVRPRRAADTVGDALERLMAEHGYPVEAPGHEAPRASG